MKDHNMFKKQQGMTLIELGVSLAIVAAVIAGALALYNATSTTQKSTQLTSDLVALRSATKQLYMGSGNYGTGNLNNVLITANKVPTTVQNPSGSTLNNNFGGAVVVTGATSFFHISVANIPTDACVNLLTADGSWNRIKIGAVPTSITETTSSTVLQPPVTPVQATTACASATQTIYFASN